MLRALVLPFLLAWPAAAEDIPACDAPRAGAVACLSGKLCRCDSARGGSVAGRPDGWRWDCSALRPACGEALPTPWPGALPAPLPELFLQLPPPSPRTPAPLR